MNDARRSLAWSDQTGRSGFTLIELMVVIGIIALLAAILTPVLGSLIRRQRIESTRHRMAQVGMAIDWYLRDWAVLGDVGDEEASEDDSDFAAAPAQFLYVRRLMADSDPYMELRPEMSMTGDPPRPVTALGEMEHIIDGFGDPLIFEIDNAVTHGRRWTRQITIRSQLGTPTYDGDDLRYTRRIEGDGSWAWDDGTP